MKKTKLFSIITLLAASTLASCGSGESQGGTKPTDQVVEVSFWHTFGKPIVAQLEKKMASFEKYVEKRDGIDLKITQHNQGGYDDLVGKMIKAYGTGTTPTISVAYPDHVANYLEINKNFVVNLDTFFNDEKLGFKADTTLNPSGKGIEDFVPAFIEEGQKYSVSGTYSLPLMKSSEVMLYNKDVVAKVLADRNIQTGVDIYMENITWDELFDMLRFINTPENRAKYGLTDAEAAPLFYDSDSNLFISQCYQREIPFVSVDENGKGSFDFNNQKAKDLVEEINGLYKDQILVTKGVKNRYGSDFFKESKSIFVVGSSGGTGYSDPGVSFDVGVCKFPTYQHAKEENRKYVTQGVTLTLLNNSSISAEKNDLRVKYGWEFMKYITNEDNNIDMSLASEGYIPVRNSSYTNEIYATYLEETDYMPRVADVVINGIAGNYINYPVFKGTDVARDQVGGIITQYLLGKKTLDVAFADAYNVCGKQI